MSDRKPQVDSDVDKVCRIFVSQLRKTSGAAIQDLSMRDHLPLSKIYEGHVYAAFNLLQSAIEARRVFGGDLPSSAQPNFQERVKRREHLMKAILDLLGNELAILDRRHEYSVAIIKREIPAQQPNG